MAVFIEKQASAGFDFKYTPVIKKAIAAVIEDKNVPAAFDINVLIVSSGKIREINKATRGTDSVTDVLSFPYFEFDVPGECSHLHDEALLIGEEILGDIIICAEKIISQAKEYGHSQKREMAFLIVHSMLHILGYDHILPQDAEVMESEQRRIMQIIDIPRE